MIRKHNRRAAKAAFAIALGVAIVLGGAAAAPAAVDRSEATPIIIGTKNFPEQYMLGQLYKQALEAKGFKVTYKENIGSTELIDTALRSGSVTLYPEYTGIMLSVTFKRKTLPKTALGTYQTAKALYEKRGQTLLKATPFQDRDGIAVLRTTASKYGLKTVGDLKQGARPDARGVPRVRDPVAAAAREPLRRAQRRVHAARRHQRLHASHQGKVEAAGIFTTDPQLISTKYVVLSEPRNMFGFQHVAPVISKKLVTENGTRLTSTLNRVNSLLTLRAMIAMNKAVAIDKKSASAVASSFLKANGLK